MLHYMVTKRKTNIGMLTFAFRDNAEITAVNKARSVGSPKRAGVTLGALLIYCLLLSGLVGKSYLLAFGNNVWLVHMAAVTALVSVGVFYSLWKCSQWQASDSGLPLQIKIWLVALLFWGTISCIAQDNWLGNLAFLLVHAGMIYLLCLRGANLIGGISKERCIDLALVPLGFMAIGSMALLALGSSWSSSLLGSQVRFRGLYSNSIVAGQMFGLTCLLLFWSILHTRSKKVWGYWALFSIAILCLVLTRTRTDIVATPIGMIACLFVAMCSSNAAIPRRRARAILGLLVLLLVISYIWLTGPATDIGRTREYLRVTGDYDDIIKGRLEYWEAGIGNLSLKNIFGDGPLAKYAGQLSTQESGYVRELNMHNTFLSVSQYYGWPGSILFIFLVASVGGTFLKRKDTYATLGLSLMAFGLVQCLTENWLLTFANPLDVYSWFILGLTLTHGPSNRRFEIADNKSQIY